MVSLFLCLHLSAELCSPFFKVKWGQKAHVWHNTGSFSNKTLHLICSPYIFALFSFAHWITLAGSWIMHYFLYFCHWPEKCAIFFSLSVLLLCYTGRSTVGARAGTSRRERGKKTSSTQWKASVLLPQLNPQMNSLHCPSPGARRRITRVDSKQRGTVERAEPCALHQLQAQHSHLSSFLPSW